MPWLAKHSNFILTNKNIEKILNVFFITYLSQVVEMAQDHTTIYNSNQFSNKHQILKRKPQDSEMILRYIFIRPSSSSRSLLIAATPDCSGRISREFCPQWHGLNTCKSLCDQRGYVPVCESERKETKIKVLHSSKRWPKYRYHDNVPFWKNSYWNTPNLETFSLDSVLFRLQPVLPGGLFYKQCTNCVLQR